MTSVALIILGMTVVTYVPRLLPLILRRESDPPEWMKRTLQLLPFTAIGALLIPDGLMSIDGDVPVATAGLIAAGLVTWLTRQPFLAVIAAVLAVMGARFIM